MRRYNPAPGTISINGQLYRYTHIQRSWYVYATPSLPWRYFFTRHPHTACYRYSPAELRVPHGL